jgi:hypothetical protein
MRRTTPLILLSLFLLVPAAAASAKGIAAAKICGVGGECRSVEDREALAALESGSVSAAPAAQAPFYRLVITVRHEDARDEFSVLFVPAKNLTRSGEKYERVYMWTELQPDAAAALRRAAAGLEPFPASRLAGTGPPDPNANVDEVILPPEEPPSGGGFGWPWVVTIAAALCGVVGGGWLYLRRRTRRRGGGPLGQPGEAGAP